MKISVILRVTLLACFSAGCSRKASYTRPPAPIPTQYSARTAPDIYSADDMSWLAVVKDTVLQRTILRALANNRDLRIAALRVEQAQAQYRISRAALLPSVTSTNAASFSGVGKTTNEQYSNSVGLSAYELDLFHRLRNQKRASFERYLATEEARRSAQISLIAEVSTQFLSWRRARAQRALSERTIVAVQESYRLTQALFNAGQTSELDVRSAEGQLRTVRVSALNFERNAAQARNALELVVGSSVPEDDAADDAFGAAITFAAVPVGLPSELVQRRPDVLQAEHSLIAAKADVGAARAALFPSLRLTVNAGKQSDQLRSLLGAGTGVWNFVPQLTGPIFQGGRLRAELASANASAQIELATYERTIQTAFREVSDALVARSNFDSLSNELDALVRAQQRRNQLARLRFQRGEDAYLSVLSAQQDLFNAEQSVIDTRFNQLTSQLALYRALGGGWN